MALAGLVANYSDSDEDEVSGKVSTLTECSSIPVNHCTSADAHIDSGKDFFAADGADSSSSEDDADEPQAESTESRGTLPNPLSTKADRLPLPSLSGTSSLEGTVFGNRFALEEKQKKAIYEKHVKMTEDRVTSQPPCFKFKKGQCRKGDSCRFRHDLGFQAPGFVAAPDTTDYSHAVIDHTSSQNVKKRPGVTNTLFPSKKARPSLDNQRLKERPWTVSK